MAWDKDDAGPTHRLGAPDRKPEELTLVVLSGPEKGRSLELVEGTHLVGTSSTCALPLSDPSVSRRHLELRVEVDGVVVRDLGSTNGSFYQGARFSEVMLGAGAVVTIGETRLQLRRRARPGAPEPSEADRFERLRGQSLLMRELFARLERVAATDVAVLIDGETGTGKELCAEAIHRRSPRAGGPFVVCDLAGVPRSLLESELFGHVRGAFTGATRDRPGAFETAQGGTLFLDEIGELELEFQSRLLRALENHAVRRLGETQYRQIDVRVVAATNRDLAQEVAEGRFREDLYHRLAVVQVRLPPLRERKDDLPLLVEQFLDGRGLSLSAEALSLLAEHEWPGNVRELRNLIERVAALSQPGATIEPDQLGIELGGAPSDPAHYHDARQALLERWERQFVERVVAEAGGNLSEAARRCGLGRAHLRRLLRKHQLTAR